MCLDEAPLPQVMRVTIPRIQWPIPAVSEVAGGHDAERADGGERAAPDPRNRSRDVFADVFALPDRAAGRDRA